jgi:ribonuclease HI
VSWWRICKKKDKQQMYAAYFDGSTEPVNPGGSMGCGVAIRCGDEWVEKIAEVYPAHPSNTNNVAEYLALNKLLDWFINNELTDAELIVRGDSQLVINQMFGSWRIKKGAYVEAAQQARKKLRKFTKVRGEWIRRERNELADSLSTQKLREQGVKIRHYKPADIDNVSIKPEPGQVIWGDSWDELDNIDPLSDRRHEEV